MECLYERCILVCLVLEEAQPVNDLHAGPVLTLHSLSGKNNEKNLLLDIRSLVSKSSVIFITENAI